MDLSCTLTSFEVWLVAGISKFLIFSLKTGRRAFWLIGYGGLHSNHSAIVSATVAPGSLKERLAHPAFGVAVAVVFIAILDTNSLRRQVGRRAEVINRLQTGSLKQGPPLRERMGQDCCWRSRWYLGCCCGDGLGH